MVRKSRTVSDESDSPLRIVQSDDEYRRRARRDDRNARLLIGVAVLGAIVLIGTLVFLFVVSPPFISE